MMSNLGLQCDMQSCYMCDSCIFDEELNNIKNIKNNMNNKGITKRYYCNDCEFLKKLSVSATNTIYNNLYCKNHEQGKTDKLIDVSVSETRMTSTPKWCAINKDFSNTLHEENEVDKIDLQGDTKLHKRGSKTFYSLDSRLKWEDIQIGKVYHIPPYNHNKRKDIIITTKTEYSATYKVFGSDSSSTLWKNTLETKLLVPHKVLVFKNAKDEK